MGLKSLNPLPLKHVLQVKIRPIMGLKFKDSSFTNITVPLKSDL